jgi:hypothetical protein
MAKSASPDIREALLAELNAKSAGGGPPTDESVLNAAAKRLGITSGSDLEEALLTQWSELFRTGLLAWGKSLSSRSAPFFHATERGRQALANLTRDPSNKAGYLRHLNSAANLGPVAQSYLGEALDCYGAGLFKAAAVMTGAAAERIVLDLRDATVTKLVSLSRLVSKGMSAWQMKTISDSLYNFLNGCPLPHPLREEFDAYWPSFTQQIRATRNDASHPTSIDPVTYDVAHASLLIFPELAKLANSLDLWVRNDLT